MMDLDTAIYLAVELYQSEGKPILYALSKIVRGESLKGNPGVIKYDLGRVALLLNRILDEFSVGDLGEELTSDITDVHP